MSRRRLPIVLVALLGVVALLLAAAPLFAQLTDVTHTPNAENAGIKKSLEEQIGAGRGMWILLIRPSLPLIVTPSAHFPRYSVHPLDSAQGRL
jgi:hypothetical protein